VLINSPLTFTCFRRFTLLILLLVTSGLLAQKTRVVTNLNDTGTGSLRQTIAASAHGDTITFSPSLLANGNATISLNSEIGFIHSLTIRGLYSGNDSLFISGNNSSSIFFINGRNFALPVRVYLEDLVLQNAKKNASGTAEANNGGALFAAGLEYLHLKRVVMRHNKLTGPADGGAMFLNEIDTVELRDCYFYGNNADTSGNFNSRGGVARARSCNVWIDNCVFKRNASDFLGGAFSSLLGNLYLKNSSWEGNIVGRANRQTLSDQRGGAISAYTESLYVSTSSFTNNLARSAGSLGGNGGAIYVSNSKKNHVIESAFLLNKAVGGAGGAIGCYTNSTDSTRLIVSKCSMEANEADKGGAIEFRNTDLIVTNCLVKDNEAVEGGAIYGIKGSLILRTSTFTDNVATSEGSDCFLDADMTFAINNSSLLGTSNISSVFLRYPFSWQVPTTGQISSSLIVNGGPNFYNSTANIISGGYNIFSGNPSFSKASDTSGLSLSALKLQPLGNYGGFTDCMPPMPGSPALNAGNPNDFTPAQNGPVFGIRDCGAAEVSVSSADTAELCGSYQWRGMTLNTPGVYTDTVFNTNTIDSIAYLHLQKPDSLLRIVNGRLLAPPRAGSTTYQWVSCDTPSTTLIGVTDSVFQPNVNGSYAVVMTRPGCADTSACMSYNQVDLQEHRFRKPFVSFYPNPSEGIIQLDVNENTKINTLMIYDLQGRAIAQRKISGHFINLDHLPPGVFLLEWRSTEGGVQRDRLIIE